MDIDSVLRRLNIDDLNLMQQDVVSAMFRSDDDIVVLSPTGSGKTIAYLLPLAEIISRDTGTQPLSRPEETGGNDGSPLSAVVIVPGRELAIQSERVLRDMGCGIRSMALYGGRPAMDEHRMLREVRPRIIFATPGRLNDHIDKGNIDVSTVNYLVIDEFDKCLAMGFHDEMVRAVGKMHAVKRRLLASATDAREIPEFVNMGRTLRVDYLLDDEQVPDRVAIYKVTSRQKDKLATLDGLLRSFGDDSTIVFLNYRDSVERVNGYLRAQGFTTSAFHGGMEQREREDNLYRFGNGSANILVSTDLASRGLDIPDVRNIVHYHLPQDEDSYIHRTGRTARWDKGGRAFFVLGPGESLPEYVRTKPADYRAEGLQDTPALPRMVTLYIGKGKKDRISRGDIVGFLCKTGGIENKDIGRIDVKERYAYVAVNRKVARQVILNTQGTKIKGIKTVVELVR